MFVIETLEPDADLDKHLAKLLDPDPDSVNPDLKH
jgi:hypothetical protein